MAAYSVMLLAVVHAALMGWQERRLHGQMSAELFRLPPLLVMERLLVKLLALGFGLLTLTLVSGGVFSEMEYQRWMKFDHKTVFAVLSWLMFGALLVGRSRYGWRGRTARLWVFAGFGALMLAYVGSRFVLGVILHRHLSGAMSGV